MPDLLQGFHAWFTASKERRESVEIDYGMFWSLYPNEQGRWRVSYNEDDKVLYAVHMGFNEYILLGECESTEAADQVMGEWEKITPDLHRLLKRLGI